MKLPIYLDYHATTPLDPRVLDAMLPFYKEQFGNAASRTHAFGWYAADAVEAARAEVANIIGSQPNEIVFTSGATESSNLILKGVAALLRAKGDHIITSATEHSSVLACCRRLEQEGFRVTRLPVDKFGMVAPASVAAAINDRTILVSIMAANNEVGTIAQLADIGKITRERGVLFHSDAAQALGKIPVAVADLKVDFLSLSAHKICGPKGVGALFVRFGKAIQLQPLIDGGGHEMGMRSGTLNVPGIVGFGKACAICHAEMSIENERVRKLRDQLHTSITASLANVTLNGHPTERLPGNLNLSFPGASAEAIMACMRDIAVSTASACTNASIEPSHVLQAMGVRRSLAHTSIRFGLGRFTTEEEVAYAARRVVEAVRLVRAMEPMEQLALAAARTCS